MSSSDKTTDVGASVAVGGAGTGSVPPSRKNSGASGGSAGQTLPGQSAGAAFGTAEGTLAARPSDHAPIRKLTTGLLSTYKLINTRYYEAKKAKQAAKAGASRTEDYSVKAGDLLGSRYRVEESMGKGSFGQVVSAVDIDTNTKVAVKVIKNKDAFRRQAKIETELLDLLNRKDPDDQWCIGG